MADEKGYLAVSGERITLQRRHHSASCREFQNSMVLSAAIFITLIGLLVYLHFVKIDQESLLIVGSLGIQMTSSYASGKETTTFIEMNQVKDVVINEAISMQKVIYYLCILLQDPVEPHVVSEVVPLFQHYVQNPEHCFLRDLISSLVSRNAGVPSHV
ncbi:phosphatidylinositol N-acetylglucosaminyltransferase subunit H isoform X3 [Varanus komodoensis]|uniref:phosphatidylinositol N-acetylglucosaminyltransferase subunit H isoform X3 n=1 Tax=Varanus komodoensis TaxID=61221 RepID=UPI001CF7C734|nr:phosphatidylinositol N-acetylglucosaminyltransferase subunit H isoform X3 [Varanus komodoensis]